MIVLQGRITMYYKKESQCYKIVLLYVTREKDK